MRAPRILAVLGMIVVALGGATSSQKMAAPAQAVSWKEVDRLVSEQKYEEASRGVDALLRSALERRASAEWTKALIRSVQLRAGLHGDEMAVRFLKEQPLAAGPALARGAGALLRADALRLSAGLLVGDRAAREGRVGRRGGPEGVDARADLSITVTAANATWP